MTDLVEFLQARLAGDERIARAAIADDCGQDGGFEDADWLTDATRVRPRFGEAAATLIQTFAVPARVLREVEAKRRLIDEHANDGGYCRTCAIEDRQENTLEEIRNDGPYMVTVHRPLLYPCPTLLLLALPYADHTDYREEWGV